MMRLLLGPATLIDGICLFFSLGFYSPKLQLATARKIAINRMRKNDELFPK
jgi:hypothetical protein